MKGDGVEGSDRGEDSLRGDVGVQRLEGKEDFEFEETTLAGISVISDEGSSTVGRDILRVPFFVGVVCSSWEVSAMVWKEIKVW